MNEESLEAEFVAACRQGDLEKFNRLVRLGVHVNCKNGAPLRDSICNNHVEIWTSLLDHPDIDPNLTDENGRTALHVANWFNKEIAVAKLLTMSSVNVNQRDNYGNTPAMMGVRYGTSDVLMIMLSSGKVDITEVDSQGRGLEHYARDSWRMSEEQKAEIEELILMERAARLRQQPASGTASTAIPGDSATMRSSNNSLEVSTVNGATSTDSLSPLSEVSLALSPPSTPTRDVIQLKVRLDSILEDLGHAFETEESQAAVESRADLRQLKEKHAKEEEQLQQRQENALLELKGRHRREESEMTARSVRASYEARMRRERELAELRRRHSREESERRRERGLRVEKYRRLFEAAMEEMKTEDTATAGIRSTLRMFDFGSIDTARTDLVSRLAKETECPVCLQDLVLSRVWQCESGHVICESCKNRPEVSSCPTCRSPFMGRAIALEKLIKTIRGDDQA